MKSVTTKLGTFVFLSCLLAACGGGGGGGGGSVPTNPPTPTPTPVVTPTPTPGSLTGINGACRPFGGVNGMSVARRAQSEPFIARRMPARPGALKFEPGMLSVIYKAGSRSAQSVAPGARAVRAFANVGANSETHVYTMPDNQVDGAVAQLKADPNVLSASRVAVRYLTSATANFTNDPYFSENPAPPPAGFTKPPAPCLETASTPGQWDLHQIGLEEAFGYATSANSLGAANPNAMGNATVKIAMIDTGADVTHPDLAGGKVVYAKCIITNAPAGTGCNAADSTDVTDFDGHGTNTAGIAAADTNNGFAFAGVGGNSSLMIYRIFSSGANSTANTVDEANAINDAVANGAKVISLSLGSPGSDPTEQAAIAAALNAGVSVVAAAGNETTRTLDFPGGYPGVVAVGATAINDSNPAAPFEYVASYSNYDAARPTTWGIVAPGGDPSGSSDADFLHWIENIYSKTPTPHCSAASGGLDFFGESGNCNALIAGTSQATPHVSGAVALLLAVRPGMTPAQVAAALASSAHNIGDPRQGYGRLNVYRLIGTALGDGNLPAP